MVMEQEEFEVLEPACYCNKKYRIDCALFVEATGKCKCLNDCPKGENCPFFKSRFSNGAKQQITYHKKFYEHYRKAKRLIEEYDLPLKIELKYIGEQYDKKTTRLS